MLVIQKLVEIITIPVCFYDLYCSNLDGSPPSVLIGVMCEKHAKEMLNLTFVQSVMFNKKHNLPIAYKSIKEHVQPMYPLLSFQFRESETQIRKLISSFPTSVDNIDMIVKLLSRASQTLHIENQEEYKQLVPIF